MRSSNTSAGKEIDASTIWRMSLIGWPLMALLLASCGSSVSTDASSANASALYDPPTVHLIEGKVYQFEEGQLIGRGQRFHSDFSYRRAIIIGK